ncbi:hypothetical protein RHGRI_012365 [Rhododendron griersonianum]|uniref:Uncharacterized protein n=1 Tax=Rhododendron griersonianum TaxID=479676 RepID=A0AAV6KQ87_9ERIC|nr:hypothetical protein RHGRI_012365 [Rhododendron griersonianum]
MRPPVAAMIHEMITIGVIFASNWVPPPAGAAIPPPAITADREREREREGVYVWSKNAV